VDKQWVAIEAVVQQAFEDKAVLESPPRTPEDWMWLAATITDHLCAAFATTPRRVD
jgi:hypothetical protein